MIRQITWFTALALGLTTLSHAETTPIGTAVEPLVLASPAAVDPSLVATAVNPVTSQVAPVRDVVYPFAKLAPPPGNFSLLSVKPEGQLEFGVRSDEVVTQATLNLEFTPSPSLTPIESQLKIYLNDELMNVMAITREQLGKSNRIQLSIDPRYITDFNRLRLVFIGHYQGVCENPTNSALWLNIGKASSLDLRYQSLPLKNDLSHFPEPFFDTRDSQALTLPIVFAAAPNVEQQKAAAILASWFGQQAQWRGQHFPVTFNQIPDRHGVVFATNDKRPDFLKDYPAVNAPTVEMISHPDDPYVKLLLVLGRDDKDLIVATTGIAQGNILFRGQNVTVDKVEQLAPRVPYDAPNWVRTERPMTFAELQQYPEQLQSNGQLPPPILLSMNLPPDLFLLRSAGIDMQLKYRYTTPILKDGSRLSVSLNDQFFTDYPLVPSRNENAKILRLPLIQGLQDDTRVVTIPALKLGMSNQLRFDFDYSTLIASSSEGRCETFITSPNHAVIDGNSTIDFSGYRHFMEMPDLRSFANAGFPFSRLADLSQTLVLVQPKPQPAQVTALLNTVGNIGAQVGYPAIGISITDDWSKAKDKDADILMIGAIPPELRDDKKINLLVDATQSWVKMPNRQPAIAAATSDPTDLVPDSKTTISSDGAMSAIIGVQSPYHDQRSIVALLADSPHGYDLLSDALLDTGKRAAVFGSVAVIRDSGVNSLRVGDTYQVGHLPWWERIWFALSTHPVMLAAVAVLVVVLAAMLLWRILRAVSRRRLSPEDRD
ncbi:cellulose biosynthesis cyclic di-GMP-binding regulatory protein BcsB [Yersinia ruckeri]|uniref:cellulose biosynthesis cyclic di-GMP-binding regulatory protein BcsB n=1 Tax=Yersinia ruckeri TaxID=29486 RepID=UPI002237E3A8|nr:cellulose biosynthesis cyclic di-GMP-binding regulatory protein BcsB [Yersinia ruckeri]EKN4697944.1 cellulose biosynthesis cyclic di-GMP-binding regulatory protein BcsB [Yersinia ruckeri]MCW6564419.1 cellulose biosynthesis cyclic di-GMP-binding regulatory protein BcsB [Yersinia ruckeri]MCW6574322.1 cellulose biosynthesis cyclic di-GMP-binding regulatory protein BcsB [Yersinia ruckeri]MCW6583342.1 cellulose biosynthesis cyclic di-GMP-binding regulatory protein BcsB [Yersinia ruckeri]MCW65995